MDIRYKRLGKNTIVVFIGNAGSRIISFLMLPFYTHYLSKAEYGTYDLINTYSTILLAVFTCCIADSIFIFPKDKPDHQKAKYFTSGILFAITSFMFTCALAACLNNLDISDFVTANIWWLIGITYSFFLLSFIQQFTRSIDKLFIYSMTGVVYVSSIAVLSLLLLPTYKLDGYLVALILASVISFLFAFFVSKSYRFFKIDCFDKNSLWDLLKYGIPLIPNSIMWWLVDGLNRPIMDSVLGIESIGIYAVANKFPSILTVLFTIFSNAWTISMLEEFGKPDFNSFFNKTMRILFFVVSVGTACLIASSKILVSIFASSEFFDAWKYVPVLTLGVLFQNISGLIGGVFAAEKKSKYFLYSSIWGAASSVILTLLFVKPFGLMGVCLSVLCSFLCMGLIRLMYAWKYINMFNFYYYGWIILSLSFLTVFYIMDINYITTIMAFIISISIILFVGKQEVNGLLLLIKRK